MNKKQNQLLGWLLISALFVGYLYFFGPKPKEKEEIAIKSPPQKIVEKSAIDTFKEALTTPVQKEENQIVLENDLMYVTFSTQGGHIKEVTLKKYKNYDGNPLVLLNKSSKARFLLPTADGAIDTQACTFEVVEPTLSKEEKQSGKQSIVFLCYLDSEKKRFIKHTFSLKPGRYTVEHQVETAGITWDDLSEKKPTFQWYQEMFRLEKDTVNSRREATVYYHQAHNNKVTYLNATQSKEQVKKLDKPLTWVTANQKFFTAGIASSVPFQGGEMILYPLQGDDECLKKVGMSLTLDSTKVLSPEQNIEADFTLYFGPNKYDCLYGVGSKFEENYYLGITPFRQITKYLLLPFTDYLSQYIEHYLLVLLILLLILTLLQLPFTYKNYILEIQQQALAPFIKRIKERYDQDPMQAQIQESKLKSKAGISMLTSFIGMPLQIAIFIVSMNLVRYHIGFRQSTFLWMEDLSTYDSLIVLPFHIPLLGKHISIVSLIASFVMMLPALLKNRQNESTAEGAMLQYMLPVILFFALNKASAAFNIYRILSSLISFIPKILFKFTIKKEPIQQAVLDKLMTKEKEGASGPPRAQKRLTQRQKKDK